MTTKKRILVVDDEVGMLEVCAGSLKKMTDATTFVEQDSRRAAERLVRENFDLLILDIRMPEVGGVELLQIAREKDPHIPVIMMTAFPSMDTAVESLKLGAADYITKPFLPQDLLTTVSRLLETKQLREENRLLQRQVERMHTYGDMVGQSPAMKAVFETVHEIAPTDVDVLIYGDTGTGKELVARYMHQSSRRNKNRFVPVDCGAIPEDLLESELFGHERGSFTGAHARSMGLLEFAHRGTFFLDEIGELPLRLQVKLLRAIQERRIRRVGGTEEIEVDVRIISATSRNLEEQIQRGLFRTDLYYRINVARIDLPPLRKRLADLPLLVSHFVERYAGEMGKEVTEVDHEVLEVCAGYPWPGNVRELQNVIKRALTRARGSILVLDDLPDEIVTQAGQSSGGVSGHFFLAREQRIMGFEKDYLSTLMRQFSGDVASAAREAELPRGTLYRLLKKHQLNPEQFRS